MSASSNRAIADLAAIGAAVRAARRKGVLWKDLVHEFGLCRARLNQLGKLDKRGRLTAKIRECPLSGKAKPQKCL
jgi:hypothetical protein